MEEMKKLFQGITTENTSGETVTGLNVYEQNLPVVTDDEEDESQFFPYALVKLETGKTADDDSPWVVATEIHFGICDHSKKNIGHRHIMNMIQDVVDRFAAEPLLNKKFRAEQDIEWAIQDEDTYPFYFGGVAISFNVPKIGRRESGRVSGYLREGEQQVKPDSGTVDGGIFGCRRCYDEPERATN